MEELPEHVRRNRAAWDAWAADYEEPGRRNWEGEPSWGIWSVPDDELRVLPEDLEGIDAIELGCGTAYVSAWLARRGARPVGIDNSQAQLGTARTLQQEFGLEFPLGTETPRRFRHPTPASTWSSLNTGPASGAIRTAGSLKLPGCYVRAAS